MTTNSFIFQGYKEDTTTGKVEFSYILINGEETYSFTETLLFSPTAENIPESLLKTSLDSLHLALGISYWKLYCPQDIQTPNIILTKKQADFWNTVYTKGLGEFYYKNKIDFRNLVSFPYNESEAPDATTLLRKDRALVGIGGGKDSIVTAKLLKDDKRDFAGFVLNPTSLQEQVVEKLGITAINMKRALDPQLFELNKKTDTYNGHVPISTMYAFTALFAAVLYDYNAVIVSNEKSANYGNVEYLGQEINHQWSKSLEFETLLQRYLRDFITPSISYFSSLRALSETEIIEMFTKYPDFFSLFSSCNTNFKQERTTDKLWCGKCAKCAFVFSQLASFLPKEKVISIFGENLFAKEELVIIYKELLGIKDIKPFDCVGTPEEVQLAFYKAHEKREYEDDIAMKLFVTDVLPTISGWSTLEENVLSKGETKIPEAYREVFTI